MPFFLLYFGRFDSSKYNVLIRKVIPFQVLTDIDHCYCVLLNAVGGAAFPTQIPPQDDTSSSETGQINKTKVWF